MDFLVVGKEIAELITEKKAEDIKFLDLREVNSYLDFFLIVTCSSGIHIRSISRFIEDYMSDKGISLHGKPDIDTGWAVLDYGELVVHLFKEETRSYYNLEKLWADAEFVI